MDIPPFPAKDLAKLVLGYLAEEDLMTAYDEFVQASPYLDSSKNYDRFMMTPLRTILADYKAVKIYVETCKPHVLRKKLMQCLNLLEMVKYLINEVDSQKNYSQYHTERSSFTKTNISLKQCDSCSSMNLKSCICRDKNTSTGSQQSTCEEMHSCLEATPLAALPGNSLKRSSQKTDSYMSSVEQTQNNSQRPDFYVNAIQNIGQYTNLPPQTQLLYGNNSTNKTTIDSNQKMQEFNKILNLVCNKNVTNEKLCDNLVSNRVSNASTFQEFASGVQEHNQEKVTRVPDSSTKALYVPIAPKLNNLKPKLDTKNLRLVNTKTPKSNELQAKKNSIDSKIKIISDVTLDKGYSCNPLNTSGLKNSACEKRLLINGNPSFVQKSGVSLTHNYSKEEIMAMPTLIILPTTGTSYNVVTKTDNTISNIGKITPTSSVSNASAKCEPLFVDVSSSMPPLIIDDDKIEKETNQKACQFGLVKPVESIIQTSVPKESTLSNKTSTPHVLPPVRKSSSTPRRTSHIRVLDFNTPRRIIDQAISDKETNEDDDVVVIGDPQGNKDSVGQNVEPKITTISNSDVRELKPKKNWDDELRALVDTNKNACPSPKVKKRSRKSKKTSSGESHKRGKKSSAPSKRGTKKPKPNIFQEESEPTKEKVVKPTINIVPANKSANKTKPEAVQRDEQNDEHHFDTPENEKLCLQNDIGIKLNISDLLETPYKQAIYDIQMETPRFLGPDLPGEPVSDIKIMNIPTPQFFDNPKLPQATPSSYSSRLTDYSSGGSYYKPDDQDFPIPDISILQNSEYQKTLESDDKNKEINNVDSSSFKLKRPTRRCTKNVSYFNKSMEKISSKSIVDSKQEKKKTPSASKPRDVKKKISHSKTKFTSKTEKYKSPFKRDASKNFMKIKPRRLTPKKDTKSRKSLPDFIHIGKNRSSIKDELLNLIPMPSKSRRKSSTPRKLQCSKVLLSSTSSNTSPEVPKKITLTSNDVKITVTHETAGDNSNDKKQLSSVQSEYLAQKTEKDNRDCDGEDITKIKEYIDSIESQKIATSDLCASKSFHTNLVERGLDVETAKLLERDLLDTPPLQDGVVQSTSDDINEVNYEKNSCSSPIVEKEASKSEPLETKINSDNEDDDIEFSVYETHEDTSNYIVRQFDEINFIAKERVHLKDTFCMEVCIEDGVSLRLKATAFKDLFEEQPIDDLHYDKSEIDSAVTSISNMEKLYTPIKDQRAECYEIFDSTLTSIDTPLKAKSPKKQENEESISEIVVEVENIVGKKRKRTQSIGQDDVNIKKAKEDTQYLLNPANIQNIDIESVLTKLHGP